MALVSVDKPLDLSGNVFSVTVGHSPNQKTYYLHPQYMIQRSKFFEKCLTGPWKEGVKRQVPLDDEDPEIFDLYVQLVYAGQLPLVGEVIVKPDGTPGHNVNTLALAELYVLADFLIDEKAKTVIHGEISSRIKP